MSVNLRGGTAPRERLHMTCKQLYNCTQLTNLFHIALVYEDLEVASLVIATGYNINTPLNVSYWYETYGCFSGTKSKHMEIHPLSFCIMVSKSTGDKRKCINYLLGKDVGFLTIMEIDDNKYIKQQQERKGNRLYPKLGKDDVLPPDRDEHEMRVITCPEANINFNATDSFGLTPLLWAMLAASEYHLDEYYVQTIKTIFDRTTINKNDKITHKMYHTLFHIYHCTPKVSSYDGELIGFYTNSEQVTFNVREGASTKKYTNLENFITTVMSSKYHMPILKIINGQQ